MNNTTITRKGFDYIGVADKTTRAVLKQEEIGVKAAIKRGHDALIEIGSRLIHAKEVAGHGVFLEWIDGCFSASYDEANDLMNVAKAFANLEISPNLPLSKSALFALAAPSVQHETRVEIIEAAKSGEVKTIAQVKAKISELQPPEKTADSVTMGTTIRTPRQDDGSDEAAQLRAIEEAQASAGYEPTQDEIDEVWRDVAAQEGDVDSPDVSDVEGVHAPAVDIDSVEIDDMDDPFADDDDEEESPAEIAKKDAPADDAPDPRNLPLARALALYGHKGHSFIEQAALWLECAKILHSCRAKKSRIQYTKGPLTNALRSLSAIPEPSKWEGCAACKGSLRVGERADPCHICGGVGFTTRVGEGVNADVVTSHAQSV